MENKQVLSDNDDFDSIDLSGSLLSYAAIILYRHILGFIRCILSARGKAALRV